MKKVITKVSAKWQGSCLVEDDFVTEEELQRQKQEIHDMIVSEMGLDDSSFDGYDIRIEYEIQ